MIDDPGGRIYCEEYRHRIQAQLDRIGQFMAADRELSSAEELMALEEEVFELTNHLGGLLVGHRLQHTLSTDQPCEGECALVRAWPKRLSSEGLVKVVIRTAQGIQCEVQARYYVRPAKAYRFSG